jgi:hypothetical protein
VCCCLRLQGFRTPEEVATFGRLMAGMADIVVHKYNGSLKVCTPLWQTYRRKRRLKLICTAAQEWLNYWWRCKRSGQAPASAIVTVNRTSVCDSMMSCYAQAKSSTGDAGSSKHLMCCGCC